MSMTREEVIATLEESKRQNKIMIDNPTTFWASHQMADGVKNAKRRIEALDHALSALRPVSREQVERIWLREPYSRLETRQGDDGSIVYSAVNTCMACGHETPIGNFCHNCGAAQTREAVEMVVERLGALYEEAETD